MILPHVALLGLLLAAGDARSARRTAPAPEVAAAVGVLAQDTLPALGARQAAAEARALEARRWFAGEAPLATAWPALHGLPLEDRAVLDGQLDAIEAAMASRAEERVAPPPAHLPAAEQARLRAAQAAALDAEDTADALTLRLLTGLRAGLERAPGLAEPALADRLLELATARAAATKGLAPSAETWAAASAEATRIGAAEAALLAYRDAARRAHTVPGDAALSGRVDADLERLRAAGSDPAADALRDRLGRALPLLDPARRTAVQAALDASETAALDAEIAALQAAGAGDEAALQRVGAEPLPSSIEVYAAAVAEAERAQRVATAETARLEAAAAAEPGELLTLRARAARLRRGRAELQAELARRRLARAERIAELGLDGADVTEAEVQAARDAAAQAREAAAQAAATAADAEARFVAQISDMSDTVVTLLEARKTRSEAVQQTLDDLEARLGTARTDRVEALALPPLAAERPRKLGAAYGKVAALVRTGQTELQDRAQALDEVLTEDAEALARFPAPDPAVAERLDPAELTRWGEAHSALLDEIALRERTARAEVTSALRLLDTLRDARREMRGDAQPSQLDADADAFFDELQTETANVPVRAQVWWWTAQRARGGGGLPDIGALVRGSVEVLFVLVLWFVARRRISEWTRLALQAASERAPATSPRLDLAGLEVRSLVAMGDPRRAHGELVAVLKRGVDALAAWLAGSLLWAGMPFIAVPLLLLAAWQGARLGPELVALLLGQTGDQRPSLRRVAPETRARAISSTGLLLGALVALRAADWLATAVLMTDRISELIRTMGLIVGALAGFVVLVRWAPTIREALERGEQNRITDLLVRPSRSIFVQGAQAALGLGLLLERQIANFMGRLIESRAGLAWLGAALARQRLKEADGAPARPLPAAVRRAVFEACDQEPRRDVELAAVQEGVAAWEAGEERGMIALVSDRGSGKSRLLNHIAETLPDGLEVVRLEPPRHLTDADAALDWLARGLGLPTPGAPRSTTARAEELILALNEMPRRAVLIDEAHKLFLRAVGGFRALRRVLEVLHATSRTHLWICAFHKPSWGFLEGVAESVNLAVFRRRVDLSALSADELAGWLEARTREAGLAISYADLVGTTVLQRDPERAEERARHSFWRLLTEEAHGNPRIARSYWLTALHAGDTPDTARVGLFESPSATELSDLTAQELFLLTAVSIHDGLSIRHLTEVLNLAGGICRAVGRRLEARGLLEVDERGGRYTLAPDWAPAIHRVLRSKQFLHSGRS